MILIKVLSFFLLFRERNEDFRSKTVIHGILGFLQGRC